MNYWVITIESRKLATVPDYIQFLKEWFEASASTHKPLEQASIVDGDGKMECTLLRQEFDGQLILDL